MTPEWTSNALQILAILGSVLAAVGTAAWWAIRSTLVTKDEMRLRQEEHDLAHDVIELRLAKGEAEFAALHADLQRMPTLNDFHALTGRVALVEGAINAQDVKIDGVHAIVDRIDRHLSMLLEFHLKEKA